MPEEELKISPIVIIPIGLGLGLAAAAAAYALAQAAPPILPENIVLSDLVIEPSQVYVGESVSISVVATNVGETVGSYEITCEVI